MVYQSGAYWQQVYEFAELNNITVIGGYHQTIASGGGWVQAGGHSILSPNYGLGIDRVVRHLRFCLSTSRLTPSPGRIQGGHPGWCLQDSQ